jgi:hypothetical protein
MGTLLLLSVIFMSVVMGVITARSRRLGTGLSRLLGLLLVYDVFYVMLLYYLNSSWTS